LNSCNFNSTKPPDALASVVNESKGLGSYALKEGLPKIKWTAYKFTDKIGVSGSFNRITHQTFKKRGTVRQLLEDASFTIETKSINSNLELRDERIYNYFFKTIDADTISGKFIEVSDTKGEININMSGKSRSIPFTYTSYMDTVRISITLDLMYWNALPGIEALNKVCNEVHIGADGISMLWTDVNVEVEIAIQPL